MTHFNKTRISWAGIIAGLVVGLVSLLAAMSLGTAITAITGLDLFGLSILALIWTIISVIASSYVAGVVAMLINKPYSEFIEVEVDEDSIETSVHKYRRNAKITGLVTGSLIVLLSTFATVTGFSNLISGGLKVFGTGTAAIVGPAIYAGDQMDIQSYLNDISREDVEALIAQSSDNLNANQIDATADVIINIYRNTRADLSNANLRNLPEIIQERYNTISQELTTDRFITRLENQGLTEDQAQEVQNTVNAYINNVIKTVEKTIETARMTMFTTAMIYLLSIALIIGFTTLGAYSVKHTKDGITEEKIKTKTK